MEWEGEKGMFRTMRLFDLPCLEQRSEDIGVCVCVCVCVCVYAHSSIRMWITEVQSYLLQTCKKLIQIQFENRNEAIWKICSNERHLIPAKFVSLNLEASVALGVGQEVRSLTANCSFLLGEVWFPQIPWLLRYSRSQMELAMSCWCSQTES